MPSHISSTDLAGVVPDHDQTGRKNVLGRVQVPVMPGAAVGAVVAAFATTGHAPLIAGQVASPAFQRARIGDAVAVTGHRQVLQAEVDTDRMPGLRKRSGCVRIHCERHVPPAVRIAGDHDRARVESAHLHVVEGPHETQRRIRLRGRQLAAAHAERRACVVRGLPRRTPLEARIPGSAGEEVGERGMLMPQRLLQRNAGDLAEGRQVPTAFPGRQRGVGLLVGGPLPFDVIGTVPLGECLVPHEAHTPEGAIKQGGLLRIRVCAALVRRPHDCDFTRSGVLCKEDAGLRDGQAPSLRRIAGRRPRKCRAAPVDVPPPPRHAPRLEGQSILRKSR